MYNHETTTITGKAYNGWYTCTYPYLLMTNFTLVPLSTTLTKAMVQRSRCTEVGGDPSYMVTVERRREEEGSNGKIKGKNKGDELDIWEPHRGLTVTLERNREERKKCERQRMNPLHRSRAPVLPFIAWERVFLGIPSILRLLLGKLPICR